MMTAATAEPSRLNRSRSACSSSSGSTRVAATKAAGTPAEEAVPKVARPEPAAGAGQADGAHGGLGARGHETHLLQSRIRLDDTLRQFHLGLTGRAKGGA